MAGFCQEIFSTGSNATSPQMAVYFDNYRLYNVNHKEIYLHMYSLLRTLIRILAPLFLRVEVHNPENIPATGGCIAAANHLGRLDAIVPYYLITRDDIILLVAEKYERYAIFRWIGRKLDAIFVDRFNADIGALRATLKRLKQGQLLVIAPEGTRSKSMALNEAQQGVVYLAAKAGVPIIPAGAVGTEDKVVKSRWMRFKRAQITVRFGDPIIVPSITVEDREKILALYTDELMCQIAALLPPTYRGFYADHPRLIDLLGDKANSRLNQEQTSDPP